MFRGVVLAAVVIAGCGYKRPADVSIDGGDDAMTDAVDLDALPPAPPLTCTSTSGTRLRAFARQHTDGSSEDLGLYDTMFQTRCTFRRASDNKPRCLPVPGRIGQADTEPFVSASVIYTTMNCSGAPLIQFNAMSVSTSKPVVANDGGDDYGSNLGCTGVLRVMTLGSGVAKPASAFRRDVNGACVSTPTYTYYSYFALGTEYAPSLFVEGSPTSVGTGRLFVRAMMGTDGSRQCSSWRAGTYEGDRTFTVNDSMYGGEPCQIIKAFDGVTRCMPQPVTSVDVFYSNSGCTQIDEVAARDTCQAAPAAPIANVEVTQTCGQTTRVRSTGSTVATAFYYKPDGSTCTPVPAGLSYNQAGNFIAETEFQELAIELGTVGSRLVRRDYVGGGVRSLIGFYDPTFESNCFFERGADGALRCAPIGTATETVAARFETIYSDSSCATEANVASWTPSSCVPGQTPPRFGIVPDPSNYRVRSWYRLGPEVTGSGFYAKDRTDPSMCLPIPAGPRMFLLMNRIESEMVSGTEAAL